MFFEKDKILAYCYFVFGAHTTATGRLYPVLSPEMQQKVQDGFRKQE